MKLENLHYRGMVLGITAGGVGDQVKSFRLDGHASETALVPAALTGKHSVEIEMGQ